MIINSLKSRIIISIAGIVVISLAINTSFLAQKTKNELSNSIEENALNLLEATKNHVESQYQSILYHKSAMLSRRKIELKNNTTIAVALINSSYQKYQMGMCSEITAKKYAMNELKHLRYDNGTGYFWINDTTRPYPRMIMHPTLPNLDGHILNAPKFNCALGKHANLFKAFVDVCLEKKQGYVDYLWPKPLPEGLTEKQPKISYTTLFKEWNWIIGTGIYVDDIETDVQHRIDAVIKELNKILVKQRIGENGYFFIFNADNHMLVHPVLAGRQLSGIVNPVTGNVLLDEFKKAAFSRNRSMEYLWDKPLFEGEFKFPKKAYITYYEPLKWYICTSIYKEDLVQKISKLIHTIILFSVCFLVISLIASLIIAKSITRPLKTFIDSIKNTDENGIPIDTIPDTKIAEMKMLGATMKQMIASISKSRERLKSQRDFCRTIINGAPYIICGFNTNQMITFINPEGEQATGYCKEEIIGKNWGDVFFETATHDQAEQSAFFSHLFDGKKIVDYEMNLKCRNGDLRNVIWNTLTRKDKKNNILEIICFGNDITKRKLAEESLANAHRQLKTVFDHSFQISIIATDAQGIIKIFNSGAERMLGYTSEEMVDKKTPVSIHLDSEINARGKRLSEEYGYPIEGFEALVGWAKHVKYDEREWTYVKKDGTHLTVNLLITAVRDDTGEVIGMVGFAKDITEKKKQDEELRHLRNYLSNIIDSMPSVLIGVDTNIKITQWNKTAERHTGIPADIALGKALNVVFPWMSSKIDIISESIRTCEIKQEQKRPRRLKDALYFEDITIYPLISNAVKGAVIRIDDVTDKVRMEEMMIQNEKMLSVGGLAAGMAHEINNPLGGIIQTASVMANRLDKTTEIPANIKAATNAGTTMEAIRHYMAEREIPRMLTTIMESGGRIAAIVDNMLSFTGTSRACSSLHDLEKLLDKTLELAATDYDLKKQYDFKTIDIKKEFKGELPPVQCEGAKIQQVLLNILRNGAQAMQTAETKQPVFTIRTNFDKEKAMVCIEIQDNGPGMNKATLKRVFEPFYTTKPVGVGTGLGLSVSYFIITENHGGEMLVESRPGCGATFIIRLPLKTKVTDCP